MKTKELNKKSGITLIALVVTILIILIISGITIATLTGHNGIINNATKAKESSAKSSIYEQISIVTKSAVSTKTLKINETKFKQALTNTFGTEGQGYTITGDSEKNWILTVNNISFVVNEEAKIWNLEDISTLINSQDTTKNEKTNKTIAVRDSSNPTEIFFLPESFKIASDSATMVDEGIVVEDEEGNQFVWVPVPDVIQKKYENGVLIAPSWNDENPKASYTPMATTYNYADSSVKGTLYRGMLYDFEEVKDANDVAIGSKSTYNTNYTPGKYNYKEPSLITQDINVLYAPIKVEEGQTDILGSSYDKVYFTNAGNFTTAASFGKQMQEDYNEMVKSVEKYKGFYIGRFETGIETKSNDSTYKKIVSKKAGTINNTTVATADATASKGNMWYGLYKIQQNFATNKKVKSSMIWGSQYDAMMNWMSKVGKTVNTTDSSKYNNAQTTGSKTSDIINNIFDLYGCHFEWTAEAKSMNARSLRGGSYSNSKCPTYRFSITPNTTYPDDCSRLTLHIVE